MKWCLLILSITAVKYLKVRFAGQPANIVLLDSFLNLQPEKKKQQNKKSV